MTAERFRQAAQLLRERATVATPGPWIPYDMGDTDFTSVDNKGWWWVWQKSKLPYYGGILQVDQKPESGQIGEALITDTDIGEVERADATYIATMAPDIALSLADWLDEEAARSEERDVYFFPLPAMDIVDKILTVHEVDSE